MRNVHRKIQRLTLGDLAACQRLPLFLLSGFLPLFVLLVTIATVLAVSVSCNWLFATTPSPTTIRVANAISTVDPTAKVETKIFVTKRGVRISLVEYTDDLVWLHGMESNDQGLFEAATLRKFYDLHRKFLAESIEVLDVDGNPMKAVLVDEGIYPFEDDLVKNGATEFHLLKRKMSFTFEFRSPQRDISFLTLKHSIVDDNFLYPAELSIELYQGTSDLPLTSKLRVDTPITIAFDWENPIPGKDADEKEKLEWLQKQEDRMLGVTDFGSVYLWGYIEQRRLRVELLLPLNVLATMFEIESTDPNFLQADEIEQAAAKIRKYFSVGNPVLINQETIPPVVQKIDFFPADQRDFAIKKKIEKLSFANGRVGVTLVYPYRVMPEQIQANWDKFSYAINSVEAYFFFEESVQRETFSRQLAENRIVWENPGALAAPQTVSEIAVGEDDFQRQGFRWQGLGWVVLALIGALALVTAGIAWYWLATRSTLVRGVGSVVAFAVLSVVLLMSWPRVALPVQDLRANDLTQALLKNVYRSFDFVSEEEIYGSLEASVAGSQLTELYLQLLSGLKMEEQGGAVSTIESIDVVESQPMVSIDGRPYSEALQVFLQDASQGPVVSFQRRIRWNLVGLVEHWGHSHERTNQYQAIATIAMIKGSWKLVDLSIESQTPGSAKPRPRRFSPLSNAK